MKGHFYMQKKKTSIGGSALIEGIYDARTFQNGDRRQKERR